MIVTQPENDRGQTLLSLKKAAADFLWGGFEEKLKTGESVRVRGKEINRGGLVVSAQGLQGFIPSSQFGSRLANNIRQLVNQEVEVKPIEVDREKNRLILSEREVSEAELLLAQKLALKLVKPGDDLGGKVVGVMNFGLFVKVDVKDPKGLPAGRQGEKKGSAKKKKKAETITLEGLVHISEISWEKVDDPNDLYKEGDKV